MMVGDSLLNIENAAGFIRGMRQGLAISNKIPDEIA